MPVKLGTDLVIFLFYIRELSLPGDTSGLEDTVPILQFLEYDMYKKVILSVTVPALSSNHYVFRSFKVNIK